MDHICYESYIVLEYAFKGGKKSIDGRFLLEIRSMYVTLFVF